MGYGRMSGTNRRRKKELWKTARIVSTVKNMTPRNLHYWGDIGLLNFEILGTKHRYYSDAEVERIAVMAYLINRCGFSPATASKVATRVCKAEAREGVLWSKYNGLVVGVPLEEIYSEAISD